MKRVTVIVLAVVVFASRAVVAQEPARLLKAAIDLEMIDHDPKAAIEQYKKVVAAGDRALAAQALLRMAGCYEKLGNAEAAKIYAQIVKDYADQGTVVAEAQKRLAPIATASSAGSTRPRLVCEDCANFEAALREDGRSLVVADIFQTSDLVIRDVATSNTTRLLAKADSPKGSDQVARYPVLAPDSRQVAFTMYTASAYELRVMPIDTPGKAHALLSVPETQAGDLVPLAWTRDGRILTAHVKADHALQLNWVSASDGSIRVAKSLGFRVNDPRGVAGVSPDGRYLAYAALVADPPRPPSTTRLVPDDQHIYVLAPDNTEVDVTPGTNASGGPVWTSDGAHLVYTSNIHGTTDVWAQPMREGRPAGLPFVLSKDVGQATTIGMTASDVFYYEKNRRGVIWSAIAQVTGSDRSSTALPDRFVGSRPRWSPDGKSIAFNRPHPGSTVLDLVVRSVADGSEQIFYRDGMDTMPVQWFGDSRGVLQLIKESSDQQFWYRVDVGTGEFKKLVANRPDPTVATHWGVKALSPDGRTIYFGAYSSTAQVLNRVVAVDVATGRVRDVWRLPGGDDQLPRNGGQMALAVSPDGQTVAVAWADPKAAMAHVGRLSTDGRDFRELCPPTAIRAGSSLAYSDGVAWAQDGQSVFFSAVPPSGDRARVMRVAASGGTAQQTGVETTPILDEFHPSPDGTRIAFSSRVSEGGGNELWALDVRALLRARR